MVENVTGIFMVREADLACAQIHILNILTDEPPPLRTVYFPSEIFSLVKIEK